MDVEKLVPETGNLNGFIEQFQVFSSAPGGIDNLRELLFSLAIKGHIEINKPNAISVDINSFFDKKALLIKNKKLKKSKTLPEISLTEVAGAIADNWEINRLGNVSMLITKGSTPTTYGYQYQNEGINFIKVENVINGDIDLTSITTFISDEAHFSQARSILEEGDVLFSIAGTIGDTCVVRSEHLPANTNQALAIIRGTSDVFLPKFLKLQLDSFVSKQISDKARGGAMNNVSLGDLSELIVFVPPLEEQKRIVAKVDELMSLCDKLEAQQQQQANNVLRANTAAINALLNPESQQTAKSQKNSATVSGSESKASFEQNWQRIAQHFNTLYGCTFPCPKAKAVRKNIWWGWRMLRG